MLTDSELSQIQSNNHSDKLRRIRNDIKLYHDKPTPKQIRRVAYILNGFRSKSTDKKIKPSDIPDFDTYLELRRWKLGMITKIIEEA